ncbi:MAG TPA: hypothetical protein VLM89_12280 [Phycisphaerae bacterium]|nr:hypothetical protein [Phycisphaerae bacterium]
MSTKETLSLELDRLLGLVEEAAAMEESAPVPDAGKPADGKSRTGTAARAGSSGVVKPPSDAIAAELESAARVSSARSLRDAPEIEAFRRELVEGLIRADTANRLLRLLNEVVTRLLR